ncbi:hypothetical protein P22_0903 [Propionispora sp. 2/2-37]|uniref:PTS sugar transporter subunit IIA n=1 Tax=Propionispora sp. 2/2-37 TaxID=1677858 RepID=UPI0006BB873E|nr:PTS sugar transporter subunit IIA [Propionispora sp. 2/2-37]CUH94837.1 hypothetical protein P22_0903 [Propionispora sp. 2/2-37]
MPVRNTFDKRLIFRNIEIGGRDEILQYIAGKMYALGYVKESYVQAVIEREKVFPTGLPTEAFGVAIPHSDAVHVNKAVIAVCILKNPVMFHVMGAAAEEVLVKFIFMLAIDDPAKHIEMLNKLSVIFQDRSIMNEIAGLEHDTVYQRLTYYMNQ